MIYRKDINGLRAFAVIPVIFFHAGLSSFSGGFLGVDVFFVISGYLITSIVVSEKNNCKFSLLYFYERRARRILPAFFFMLTLTTIAAIILMLPSQLKEFGQSIIASSLFSANIFFWLKTDYWAQAAELTPLLHIWSLGVEEQFYIFFPFLVIFLNESFFKRTIAVIIFLSFTAMTYERSIGHASDSFYLLPFRAWELATGAFAATHNFPRILHNGWIKTSAVMFLTASFFNSYEFIPTPLQNLIPIFCTYLIISIRETNDVGTNFLSHAWVQYIGKISYSLYLFHQPVFSLARLGTYNANIITITIISFVVTIILACLSYHTVEKVFIKNNAKKNKKILYFSLLFITCFLLLGTYLHKSDGLRKAKLSNLSDYSRKLIDNLDTSKENRMDLWKKTLINSESEFTRSDSRKILFVGDSLSEDLYVASQLALKKSDKFEIRRIPFDDQCIKHLSTKGNEIGLDNKPCLSEINKFSNSNLTAHADVIVIAEAWLNNAKYLTNFLKLKNINNKKVVIYLSHGFSEISSLLLYSGKSNLPVNSHEFKKFAYLSKHQQTIFANKTLKLIAEEHHLITISSYEYFCDEYQKECTVVSNQDLPLIIDQAHLSITGAEYFSRWFTEQLLDKLN